MNRKQVLTALVISLTGILLLGIWLDNFFLAWLGWGLIFAAMEFSGLTANAKGDTLSEQVWLGTRSRSRGWKVFWVTGVTFLLVWLIYHFITGNPWFVGS